MSHSVFNCCFWQHKKSVQFSKFYGTVAVTSLCVEYCGKWAGCKLIIQSIATESFTIFTILPVILESFTVFTVTQSDTLACVHSMFGLFTSLFGSWYHTMFSFCVLTSCSDGLIGSFMLCTKCRSWPKCLISPLVDWYVSVSYTARKLVEVANTLFTMNANYLFKNELEYELPCKQVNNTDDVQVLHKIFCSVQAMIFSAILRSWAGIMWKKCMALFL